MVWTPPASCYIKQMKHNLATGNTEQFMPSFLALLAPVCKVKHQLAGSFPHIGNLHSITQYNQWFHPCSGSVFTKITILPGITTAPGSGVLQYSSTFQTSINKHCATISIISRVKFCILIQKVLKVQGLFQHTFCFKFPHE
jgi:hypothetical protein